MYWAATHAAYRVHINQTAHCLLQTGQAIGHVLMASPELHFTVIAFLVLCMHAENPTAEQAESSGSYPVTLLLPAGVSTSFTITAPRQKHTVALLPSDSPQVSPSASPLC